MNRSTALTTALLGTLGLSAWLALQPADDAQDLAAVVRPLQVRRGDAAPSVPAAAGNRVPLSRPASAWGSAPPAAVAAWSAPVRVAPPAAAASASERAAPPRFPYTWIGRVDDGGSVQALLNGPQRSFGVQAGEVLDGRWRVEGIAATRLQLTWLPTGEAVNVDVR